MFPSIIAGVALFCIIAIESFRVLVDLLHYLDPGLALDQREALLKQSILRMISAIDGYLLGAFMLIFGFGLYELSWPICRKLVHLKRPVEFSALNRWMI